jgi:type IV pilus assembly protein PilW
MNNRTTVHPVAIRSHVAGFTLVELMVGLLIGIFVLLAATSAFLNVSSSRREMEKTNRQMENGRYAMQLLSDDIALAGYWGEFDPTLVSAPAAIPDPCTVDPATLKLQIPMHVQTYTDLTAPTCVSDVKTGTPIIVVRRVASCVAGSGTGDCAAAAAGTTYFQSALCNAELALPTIAQRYVTSSTLADFTLHKRDCVAIADMRKYLVHIYFVANNNNAGDGIPTLKRVELGAGAMSAQALPLVEGIDSIQVEYALDTDANGTPNVFSTDPSTYNGCAGAACVSNLANIVGVKLYVLARNTESTPSFTSATVYPMGAVTAGPFSDAYKRHAYASMVRVTNAAGRRE